MGMVFYHLSVEGEVRGETIINGFMYREDESFVTDPTVAMMTTVITRWQVQCRGGYLGVKPTEYNLVRLVCSGFQSDGTPSTNLPVVTLDGSTGGQTNELVGPANTAVLVAGLGAPTVVRSGGKAPRRGHWAIGPIPEFCYDEAGTFVPANMGAGVWAAFLASVLVPLTVAGVDDIFPIKWSNVIAGAVTPNVCAYRELETLSTRARGSFRRSRNNGR